MSETEKAAENVAQTTQNEGGEKGFQKLEEEARKLVFTQPGQEGMTIALQRQLANDLQSATITNEKGEKVSALPELALAWAQKNMKDGVSEESLRKELEKTPVGGFNPQADNDPLRTLMLNTLRTQYNQLKNDKTIDTNGDGTLSPDEIGSRLNSNVQNRSHARDNSGYATRQDQDRAAAALLEGRNGTNLFKIIETENPSFWNGKSPDNTMSKEDLDGFVKRIENPKNEQDRKDRALVTDEQFNELKRVRDDWNNGAQYMKDLVGSDGKLQLSELENRYGKDKLKESYSAEAGNAPISDGRRGQILDALSNDPKLRAAVVEDGVIQSREKVQKALENPSLTPEQRKVLQDVNNSYNRLDAGNADHMKTENRDGKIVLDQLAKASRGPNAKFEAAAVQPNLDPNTGEVRGRTKEEANADVQALFKGKPGEALWDRLRGEKQFFNRDDVESLQERAKENPKLLTEQQRKDLDALAQNFPQYDRGGKDGNATKDQRVYADEIQAPRLEGDAKPKTVDELRREANGEVAPGSPEAQAQARNREALQTWLQKPETVDQIVDANGNLKKEEFDKLKEGLKDENARPNESAEDKAKRQAYRAYIETLKPNEDGSVPMEQLAKGAGYASWQAAQEDMGLVKPSAEDQANLQAQLSKSDSKVRGAVREDGKVDREVLDKLYDNRDKQNPPLSEEDRKAVETLHNSYARLTNPDGTLKAGGQSASGEGEQPPKLETEKYNPVYGKDTLSGMAQRMGFGSGKAGWEAFIKFQEDNGNKELADRLRKDPNKIYPADSFVIPKGGKLPPGYKPKP